MILEHCCLCNVGCELLWTIGLRERIKSSRNSPKESIRLFKVTVVVVLKSPIRRRGAGERKYFYGGGGI